jgi:phage shock protein A
MARCVLCCLSDWLVARQKLALALDIAMVEDKTLLERVERLSVAEWVGGGEAASIGALPKDKGADKAKEEALARQLEREKQQHEEEIRAAAVASRQQQDAQDAVHAKELKRLQRKLEAAKDRAEELETQLEEAQAHVAQTKQFQALKKMVATKNEQLQELRRRLRRHEPDADDEDDGGETKNADDDDE